MFRVAVNGKLSTEAEITSGSAQGTISGCLAYVLYTNSIRSVVGDRISYKTYADDTKKIRGVQQRRRQTHFILRCFVSSEAYVYMRLFQTYGVPILTYCAPVWNPRLKKDEDLIQSLSSRFRRMIAHRCKNNDGKLSCIEAEMVFADADQKMFARICKDSTFCDPLSLRVRCCDNQDYIDVCLQAKSSSQKMTS